MRILLLVLCMYALGASAQSIELSQQDITNRNSSVSLKRVSIHDPSIVFNPTDNSYYIVGSHMGWGVSTDIANWTSINVGYEGATLFGKSYATAFASCPTHQVQVTRGTTTTTETLGSYNAGAHCATYAGITVGSRNPVSEKQWISGDMWAPDIIYNPHMGKWCMYLSLNGDNWASVIILLTANSPKGPFTYQAPIVFGGFNGQSYSGKSVDYKNTDLELVLGTQASLPARYRTSAWGNLWPNCIDPCVFFDDDGELWMSYGSWSGGIFMLKLDKSTGLRDYTYTYTAQTYSGKAPNGSSYTGYTEDQYFGKLIAGGAYVSGEASYIQKIGNYYYLFMTYGGLESNGGYEMRVFRSTSPTGPYKDGNGIAATYTSYALNFGPNATTNKGMKVIGAMNNWGTMTVGECAEGHNSAIVDKDGNAYIVFHTRFNNGTEGHQVRVHRLYVNGNGWLVTSPFQYTGPVNSKTGVRTTTQKEIESTRIATAEEIAGTYQLLIHRYKLDHKNKQEITPMEVTLTADGKIEGTYTGSWSFKNESSSYVTLIINGTIYYGVIARQSVNGKALDALCFTSVSTAGVLAWLYKLDDISAIADNYNTIYTNFLNKTKATAAPPTNWGVFATYNSAMPDVFSNEGLYTPASGSPTSTSNINVKATLSKGNYYYTFSRASSPFYKSLGVDITSGKVAHYKLNSLTCVNDSNTSQAMKVGRGNSSGKMPVLVSDDARKDVLNIHFGSQSAASYGIMPNPLKGSGATAFTVSFWVKPMALSQWDNILAFFNGTLPTSSGGRFFFTDNTFGGFNDGTGNYFDVNNPNAAGKLYTLKPCTWSFVTITLSPSGYTLYINGVAQTQKSFGSSATGTFDYADAIQKICSYNNMCLGMGSYWGSSHFFISDLSVYTRALTANDAKLLYGVSLSPYYNLGLIPGDANGDGRLTMGDAKLVNDYYIGKVTDAVLIKKNADINGDEKVTLSDANAIANKVLGK